MVWNSVLTALLVHFGPLTVANYWHLHLDSGAKPTPTKSRNPTIFFQGCNQWSHTSSFCTRALHKTKSFFPNSNFDLLPSSKYFHVLYVILAFFFSRRKLPFIYLLQLVNCSHRLFVWRLWPMRRKRPFEELHAAFHCTKTYSENSSPVIVKWLF